VEIGKGRVVTGNVQTRSGLGDMESSREDITPSRDTGKDTGIHRTMEIVVSHDPRGSDGRFWTETAVEDMIGNATHYIAHKATVVEVASRVC
jgi:hypothetical protein